MHMKIINLYGGPGTGKSTVAAELFVLCKKAGYNVELIPEYAKSMVYEKRFNILDDDQLYILAKQHRSIYRLLDQPMDYVVVDSPIVNSAAYNQHKNLNQDILNLLVRELNNKYDNTNIFLTRNPEYGYNPNGRIQATPEEADIKSNEIRKQLDYFNIEYTVMMNDNDIASTIYELVCK